jgi:hypothetical protein
MIHSRHHLLNIKLSDTALHSLNFALEYANRICIDLKISVSLRLISNQIHGGLFDHRIADGLLGDLLGQYLFGGL